jgi:hypothetical protein
MIDNMIKVRYCAGETGWAEDLGDGKVKIANCPLTRDLRKDDVCSVVYRDGWVTVDEVLERKFPHSATIWYSETKYWYLIRGGSLIKGWSTEGGIGPRDGSEGFLTINYNGNVDDLEDFLETLYIKDQVRISRLEEEDEEDE